MPETTAEIEQGEHYWIPAKSFDQVPTPEDVIVYSWAGAGGYGDPIERDPEARSRGRDRRSGPREWDTEAYGVVLSGEGSADRRRDRHRATPARDRRGAARRGAPYTGDPGAHAGNEDAAGSGDQRLTEYLELRDGQIRAGDITLGPVGRNWKLGALVRDLPLDEGQSEPA